MAPWQPETAEQIYDEETVTTQIQVIETRTALISMNAERIVTIKIKPDLLMTLADARADMAAVQQLTQDMAHGRLLDLRQAPPLTHEVRMYFRQPELHQAASALAIVFESTLSHIIASLIAGMISRRGIVRMFTSEQAALEWLHQTTARRPF